MLGCEQREQPMKKLLSTSALGLRFLLPIFILPTFPAVADSDNQIEEVVVSASLLPIAAKRSANAITVIDSEQIRLSAALSVSDLLRDVPGLAVSQSGPLGSMIDIRSRGSESNHMVVLVDGIEVNDPSQDDKLNWGTFSATDIERIEVIRGPQSSLRGSDAIAGVINIITANANQPFSANFYSEAGSRSTFKNGFNVGHQTDKLNLRLAGSHVETDGINIRPTTGDDIDGYRNTGLNLKAGYKVSEQVNLSFVSSHTDGMNEFDGDPEVQYSEFNRLHTRFKVDYNSTDGLWSHVFSLANSKFENDNFKQQGTDPVAPNGATESSKQNYQYIGSRFWEVGNQRLSLALEREKEEFKQFGGWATGADSNKFVNRNTDSVALEYRFEPRDSITLAVSSRYEDNDQFKSSNTQRFEAIYQQNDNLRFRGAWGTAVKNPTFTELYGIYYGFKSNPNLSPEESQSWELGFDVNSFDGRLEIGATFFDAKLKHEIGSDCDENWVCMPINTQGLSNREGVEFSSSLAVNDSLSLAIAYTYTNSKQAGTMEIRRPKNIGSANIAWQMQSNIKVSLNIKHNGSQTDLYDKALEAYTLVNLNANYNASEKLDIYMSLNNLFDKDYQDVAGYETLGFGANMGLRYKF
jgi:vitamin B12 transporter